MMNLDRFISKYVTKREKSMFLTDIEANDENLRKKIRGKSVLVIGGAGSIGSAFFRAILPYEAEALVVGGTNEKALSGVTRGVWFTETGSYLHMNSVT